LDNLFYQDDNFENEAYNEGMTYGRGPRRSANPNRGDGFPFPNHDRRREYSNPNEYRMTIEILSFSGNLDIESFLHWAYEIEKFFDMAYIPEEKHIKFIAYKLKGGATAWWD